MYPPYFGRLLEAINPLYSFVYSLGCTSVLCTFELMNKSSPAKFINVEIIENTKKWEDVELILRVRILKEDPPLTKVRKIIIC